VNTLSATSQELSALVAGARMALEVMRRDPRGTPPEATEQLEHVLADYERAVGRLEGGG
jgi:hypothetical protein